MFVLVLVNLEVDIIVKEREKWLYWFCISGMFKFFDFVIGEK